MTAWKGEGGDEVLEIRIRAMAWVEVSAMGHWQILLPGGRVEAAMSHLHRWSRSLFSRSWDLASPYGGDETNNRM